MRFIVQGTDYDCGYDYDYDKGFLLLIMRTFYIVTKLSAVQVNFCAIQVI